MKCYGWMLTCGLLAFATPGFSQSQHLLDGKVFKVKTWDSTKSNLKTPESLEFNNGKVDAPVCHMYGFYAAPYEAVKEMDGVSFSFVSKSVEEGTLYFNGKVKDEKITGRYIWRKDGREDLEYEFEGELN